MKTRPTTLWPAAGHEIIIGGLVWHDVTRYDGTQDQQFPDTWEAQGQGITLTVFRGLRGAGMYGIWRDTNRRYTLRADATPEQAMLELMGRIRAELTQVLRQLQVEWRLLLSGAVLREGDQWQDGDEWVPVPEDAWGNTVPGASHPHRRPL